MRNNNICFFPFIHFCSFSSFFRRVYALYYCCERTIINQTQQHGKSRSTTRSLLTKIFLFTFFFCTYTYTRRRLNARFLPFRRIFFVAFLPLLNAMTFVLKCCIKGFPFGSSYIRKSSVRHQINQHEVKFFLLNFILKLT